ncbi:MAG: hypothetical protein JSS49_10345 [Planctomycetes bacterium]|nr:hypothetical protein [Planctomycetota bacterium]
MKSIEFCRKQGYQVSTAQQREVFQQLKADYEIVLKKEHEKAEQIRVREQMREEQRVQREIQKELERTQRESARRDSERDAIEHALADALSKIGGTERTALSLLTVYFFIKVLSIWKLRNNR